MTGKQTTEDLLLFAQQQIKRWLKYHSKGRTETPDATPDDPITLLFKEFTGSAFIPRPRQPIPFQLWGKANHGIVDAEFKKRRAISPPKKKKVVSFRNGITRELFLKLPKETRATWQARAEQAHSDALAEREAKMSAAIPTDPKSRQR